MYQTCVLSTLLCASETWTLYQSYIKQLERFHQHYLRHILGIKCDSHVPDAGVLTKAKTISIAAIVIRNQMCWVGHLVQLDDSRLPKQLFYGEILSGKRPQHKPKKLFWDSVKYFGVPVDDWESLAFDRGQWRALTFEGAELFEADWVKLKRACRKQEPLPANCGDVWVCEVCNQTLLSKAGLVNHVKSHESNPTTLVAPPMPCIESQDGNFSCSHCSRVYQSDGGLKRHMKVHSEANTILSS